MTFDMYREKFGIKLNAQQEQAVLRTDGHTLLLAVPGSGKTTVIVSRLGYMIKCLGIPESKILTLTYSVAACRDMKERYISYFGVKNVPEFRTIHGICSIIIRKYESMKGTSAFTLMGGEESENSLLSEVFLKVCGQYPESGQINELKTCITYIRNMMFETERAKEIFDVKYDICAVMEAYRHEKISRKLMDYDDQLEFAYKILRQYPHVLDYFRKRFIYVNVDEAQDTSKIQHEIIGLLESGNLFMVGDEDQSIYGFRAAYPKALLDFDKKYPDAVVLYMEENFRSTANIIKRASRLISNNRERRPKNMFTVKEDGEDIEILNFPTRRNQYKAMCEIGGKIPYSKETTAILFRNNDSALPFIASFEKHGIKYRYRESDCPFFENPGICDILALLDVVYKNNAESFMYVAKRLGCGLHEQEIRFVVSDMKHGRSPGAAIKNCIEPEDERSRRVYELGTVIERAGSQRPSDGITLLCTSTCFGRFLDLRMKDMDSKTGILAELAYDCKNYEEFDSRIRNLKNIVEKGSYPDGNCIILSTVHSSKGLEYDNVFITDVKDGEFPCIETPEHCLESERPILEEERRLFYVAVTRARKKVTVIRYVLEMDSGICRKSTFVRELMRYEASMFKTAVKAPDSPAVMRPVKSDVDISRFVPGTKVIHKNYGNGVIVSCEGDKCRIDFENGIAKILSLSVALDAGVLVYEKM